MIQTQGRGPAPGGKQHRTTPCPNQSSYWAAAHQLRPTLGAVQPSSTPGMLPAGRQEQRHMPWQPLHWLHAMGDSSSMEQSPAAPPGQLSGDAPE